ncbi:TorD/DmsD family molecular chaperone [Neptunomonas concharum]|uniref:Molecular chaperone n=1 Tax=Neptunomonas concharum TaxID=1031538 RepID=A0A5P1RE47_9GAMM|nr:molecular chaperone TorD family protein [Neptunomonas concharum]QEQ97920.1 molecular chaperone [Neptunomonas concharum]
MEMINLTPALQEHDQLRADIYALLGNLLRSAPSAETLEWLSTLTPDNDDSGSMADAWSALALTANYATEASIADEYQDLFIGVGRGELMPFGCWYLTGSLMEKPLVQLRNDLTQLGYVRQPDVYEPEDHIAALCEVMSLMILNHHGYSQQHTFWQRHIAPWARKFFSDLQHAKRAVFYSPIGLLGEHFVQKEADYFQQLSPAELTTVSASHNKNSG